MTILAILAAMTIATGEPSSGPTVAPNELASVEQGQAEFDDSRRVKSCMRVEIAEVQSCDLQRISRSDRSHVCWTSD